MTAKEMFEVVGWDFEDFINRFIAGLIVSPFVLLIVIKIFSLLPPDLLDRIKAVLQLL